MRKELNTDIVRLHVLVTGLVQGVGYRYYALTQARQFGVTGWVRNRFDDTVELEVQGERDMVEGFVDMLRIGPQWGKVERVDADPMHVHRGGSRRFEVRPDAA